MGPTLTKPHLTTMTNDDDAINDPLDGLNDDDAVQGDLVSMLLGSSRSRQDHWLLREQWITSNDSDRLDLIVRACRLCRSHLEEPPKHRKDKLTPTRLLEAFANLHHALDHWLDGHRDNR